MLKISKMADYGIVIMHHMAGKSEKTASASDISRYTHLNLPTVSNILKMLAEHKLVTSQRGANGGYKLALPASDISVADIISAIEGPIQLTECSMDSGQCSKEVHCRIADNWKIINHAVTHVLKQLRLADLQSSVSEHPVILNNLKPQVTLKHD